MRNDSDIINDIKNKKDEKKEDFQSMKNEILGKRKALDDYVDKYLNEKTSQKTIKNIPSNRKKVEKNLLSFAD